MAYGYDPNKTPDLNSFADQVPAGPDYGQTREQNQRIIDERKRAYDEANKAGQTDLDELKRRQDEYNAAIPNLAPSPLMGGLQAFLQGASAALPGMFATTGGVMTHSLPTAGQTPEYIGKIFDNANAQNRLGVQALKDKMDQFRDLYNLRQGQQNRQLQGQDSLAGMGLGQNNQDYNAQAQQYAQRMGLAQAQQAQAEHRAEFDAQMRAHADQMGMMDRRFQQQYDLLKQKYDAMSSKPAADPREEAMAGQAKNDLASDIQLSQSPDFHRQVDRANELAKELANSYFPSSAKQKELDSIIGNLRGVLKGIPQSSMYDLGSLSERLGDKDPTKSAMALNELQRQLDYATKAAVRANQNGFDLKNYSNMRRGLQTDVPNVTPSPSLADRITGALNQAVPSILSENVETAPRINPNGVPNLPERPNTNPQNVGPIDPNIAAVGKGRGVDPSELPMFNQFLRKMGLGDKPLTGYEANQAFNKYYPAWKRSVSDPYQIGGGQQ